MSAANKQEKFQAGTQSSNLQKFVRILEKNVCGKLLPKIIKIELDWTKLLRNKTAQFYGTLCRRRRRGTAGVVSGCEGKIRASVRRRLVDEIRPKFGVVLRCGPPRKMVRCGADKSRGVERGQWWLKPPHPLRNDERSPTAHFLMKTKTP